MKTFVLTADQEMLLGLAHDLAEAEIRPRSEAVDHECKFPAEGIKILAEAGLVGCTAPEAYGGAALDAWCQIAVIGEVAKECASTAWALAMTAEAVECVTQFGTDAQKDSILPLLLSGGCAAVAGSDNVPGGPEVLTASAVKTDDGYVLHGVKKNVFGAGCCDWYLIKAQAEDAAKWFLVSASSLTVRSGEEKLGFKGCPTGELVLDGSRAEELCGAVDDMVKAAQTLDMAAIAAGVAQGALREAIQYVNQRVQFKKRISEFENTQQVMSELLAKTEACRALVWNAAQVKSAGEMYGYAAALAKIAAADNASIVTRKCVQFMGGYGYSREYPVERKMRDAKMCEMCAGSTELQKTLAAQTAVVE